MEENGKIEDEVGRRYLARWGGRIDYLRSVLSEKTWVGFDLDDTLHEFRLASSAATDVVLEAMHVQYSMPLADLKAQYVAVLRSSTSNAFADGRTSKEYRQERLLAVARHFSLPLNHQDEFLVQLICLYEKTLQHALQLKSDALPLLQALKRLGKKVTIITEGPQDAQEWTLTQLGIASYVDFLATTNHFGVSKTDGLFAAVLKELGIAPSQMAYVGDSETRDMVPAIEEGIVSFHFAEGLDCDLEVYPPRINTLGDLLLILPSNSSG